MTIEEIFMRGNISMLTRNACMANGIKTLIDLREHYHEREGFRGLMYCGGKCNDELIAVYNKYEGVYIEVETSQTVFFNRSEPKLVDVVTDLDDVIETTHAADVSFEEIEQMLKDHWEKKGIRSVQSEPYTSKPSKSIEEIERMLKDHWEKKGIRSVQSEPYVSKPSVSLEELEQRLKNHWRKKASEKTSQIEKYEYFAKATSRVYSADLKKVAKSKSIFGRHPSKELNRLYSIKSYQGANPVDAKVIFVGRDPNWAADIEKREMFGSVVEYLTDGISFWKEHNIHHPFLLKGYRGDGRRYHSNFSKLNLDSSVASKVSFVELIGFPTTGMAKSNISLFKQYLFSEETKGHLIELDKVLNNHDKVIFIAWGLINDFKIINERTGLFERFAKLDKSKMDISDLNEYENIFIHRHFSDSIKNITIAKMEKRVREHLYRVL